MRCCAQVQADYEKYAMLFGATTNSRALDELFYRQGFEPAIKIRRAVEAGFEDPQGEDDCDAKALMCFRAAPVDWMTSSVRRGLPGAAPRHGQVVRRPCPDA